MVLSLNSKLKRKESVSGSDEMYGQSVNRNKVRIRQNISPWSFSPRPPRMCLLMMLLICREQEAGIPDKVALLVCLAGCPCASHFRSFTRTRLQYCASGNVASAQMDGLVAHSTFNNVPSVQVYLHRAILTGSDGVLVVFDGVAVAGGELGGHCVGNVRNEGVK